MFVSMAFRHEFGFSVFHLFPFLLLKKKKGHSVSQSGFRPGNPKKEEEEQEQEEKVLETRLRQVDIKIMKTQNREGTQSEPRAS